MHRREREGGRDREREIERAMQLQAPLTACTFGGFFKPRVLFVGVLLKRALLSGVEYFWELTLVGMSGSCMLEPLLLQASLGLTRYP